jgi:hypothetical protein
MVHSVRSNIEHSTVYSTDLKLGITHTTKDRQKDPP